MNHDVTAFAVIPYTGIAIVYAVIWSIPASAAAAAAAGRCLSFTVQLNAKRQISCNKEALFGHKTGGQSTVRLSADAAPDKAEAVDGPASSPHSRQVIRTVLWSLQIGTPQVWHEREVLRSS